MYTNNFPRKFIEYTQSFYNIFQHIFECQINYSVNLDAQ